LLIASIAAASWGGVELYRQYRRLLIQEQAVSVLRRASHRPQQLKPSHAELEAERHWNALGKELSFSWYPIFAALEHVSNPDIALLEFVPDKTAGRMTLRGTARDMETLINYIAALADEPVFHEVYLSHQKKIAQNNLEVISFEIRAQL
jgi:hypothetical protein